MPDSPSAYPSPLDFASPYELMVGVWSGMATLYTAKGEFRSLTPSIVSIYWKQRPTLLRYRQIEQTFSTTAQPSSNLNIKPIPMLPEFDAAQGISGDAAILQTTNLHFDLQVDGKHCQASLLGGPGLQSVEGTQHRPGVYIFNLGFRGGRWYNNQYFIDANERHIIGPYVRDNNPAVAFVVAQAFTRVSYDVPPELQGDLAK